MEKKIKEIINEVMNFETPAEDIVDNNLIETYGINSIDALEILIHMENEFDIEIDEEDLNAELIDSISNLTECITNKLS